MSYKKIPLFVEVIGEPEAGKTHLSCLFPYPALFDTTPSGEAYKVLQKLYPDEWRKRYFRIRDFDDFMKKLRIVKNDSSTKVCTVIVDTSVDLRVLGGEAHLKELKGDRKRLMPEEWAPVNSRIDSFINEIINTMGLNLVFTAQMQDEWANRNKTGRRIRKGVPNMNFQARLRLYLQVTQKTDENMRYINEWERKCLIIKNSFRNKADKEDWKVTLDNISWKGIKELVKLEDDEFVE